MKIRIFKDEIEIKVATPISKTRKILSESKIDFSVIHNLIGDKRILRKAFLDEKYESIS